MNLFQRPDAPRPPTFAETLARANAALPGHVRVAFKPFRAGPGQVRNARPYRVIFSGQDVGGASSLEGALFQALAQRKARFDG